MHGLLVDVQNDAAVAAAYQAWDANPASSSRANDVAESIKDLVTDLLRTHTNVRYLVIAGDDRVVPFYRLLIYPYGTPVDSSWVRENQYPYIDSSTTVGAAMQQNMTLTDDYYADFTPQIVDRIPHQVLIPDFAIGRLVETPAEIAAVVNAFLAGNGATTFQTASVAGWTFVEDAADEQCTIYASTPGVSTDCSLVGGQWGPVELRQRLLDGASRHRLLQRSCQSLRVPDAVHKLCRFLRSRGGRRFVGPKLPLLRFGLPRRLDRA